MKYQYSDKPWDLAHNFKTSQINNSHRILKDLTHNGKPNNSLRVNQLTYFLKVHPATLLVLTNTSTFNDIHTCMCLYICVSLIVS